MRRADDLSQAAAVLRRARRIAVLTGAGISVESGIDTFRGAGGAWAKVDLEEVASLDGFERNPRRVWEWYDARRVQMCAARPNPGHLALAELGRRREMTVITQNIDGLHHAAGSERVIEFHGSLWRVRCMTCGISKREERAPLPELPPRCDCGGLLRPDVIWFGELVPAPALEESWRAVRESDAFMLIGTSALVTPAADLAGMALELGLPLIEVNLERTPYSRAAIHSFQGKAGEVLPGLLGEFSGAGPPPPAE